MPCLWSRNHSEQQDTGKSYHWPDRDIVSSLFKESSTLLTEKLYDKPRQQIKKQRHYFANKSPSTQSYDFSSSHVWMRELDHKENWVPKNWCFWTVVLEKTLESPWDCKEIQPVNSKGNQSWIFMGRTDAEAETPILWPPDAKNGLMWKDPGAGSWWWEEKGMTEDKTVGWHVQLDGHEFEQAPGVGDGQGSLAYCNPWGHKELDTTEQLNWTEPSSRGWSLENVFYVVPPIDS